VEGPNFLSVLIKYYYSFFTITVFLIINALFTWALVTCPFTMLVHPDWVLAAFTALGPALARHGI